MFLIEQCFFFPLRFDTVNSVQSVADGVVCFDLHKQSPPSLTYEISTRDWAFNRSDISSSAHCDESRRYTIKHPHLPPPLQVQSVEMFAIGFDDSVDLLLSTTNSLHIREKESDLFPTPSDALCVSFGNLRLLRQVCFRGERLVPPMMSTVVAIALPWGCNAHVVLSGVDSAASSTVGAFGPVAPPLVLSPSDLVRRTIHELLAPFDVHLRSTARSGAVPSDGDGSADGTRGGTRFAGSSFSKDSILDDYGLWCRSYRFLVDRTKTNAYLVLETISTTASRILKDFTSRVQFVETRHCGELSQRCQPHRRRFVAFPLCSSMCLLGDGSSASLFEAMRDPVAQQSAFTCAPIVAGEFYEVPSCVVCLDRLDVSISGLFPRLYGVTNVGGPGLLSVVCAGSSSNNSIDGEAGEDYCTCLVESSCPMCRLLVGFLRKSVHDPVSGVERIVGEFDHLPPIARLPGRVVCNDCGIDDDLYQCLMCGHIGCSRYRSRHARNHYCSTSLSILNTGMLGSVPTSLPSSPSSFPSTPFPGSGAPVLGRHSHAFSMCLASQEIWDYDGDAFAHRLITRVPQGAPGAVRQAVFALRSGVALSARSYDFGDAGPSAGPVPLVVSPRSLNDPRASDYRLHTLKESPGGLTPPHSGDFMNAYFSDGLPIGDVAEGGGCDDCLKERQLTDTVQGRLSCPTNVTILKYDAKMEHLCTRYTNLLSHQAAEHRRSYEDRLDPLLEHHASLATGVTDLHSDFLCFSASISEAATRFACATAALQAARCALTDLECANVGVRTREAELGAQIAAEKYSVQSMLGRRISELRSRDDEITSLRELTSEVEINLATRSAIAQRGGCGGAGVVVMGQHKTGAPLARGRGGRR